MSPEEGVLFIHAPSCIKTMVYPALCSNVSYDARHLTLPRSDTSAMTTHRLSKPHAKWVLALCIAALVCVVAAIVAYNTAQRAPGELLRYAERRAEGHPKLEVITKPLAAWLRPQIERPVSKVPEPSHQGQQPASLPPQLYAHNGQPAATVLTVSAAQPVIQTLPHLITPSDDLATRLRAARPGDTFELLPGHYRMLRSIRLNQGGAPGQPVTLRAARPGTVVIESTAAEGFVVQSPYWTFENLLIRGTCPIHSNCEHAFHVVGKATGTVIRNNHIENFNAHIKVNGLSRHWPDQGLVQFNTLTNTAPRRTGRPVTPIDIVAANDWHVLDNHISDFVKADGNQISYGVFMKGSGQHGVIARNLIICTSQHISQPGQRVAASFGGGGTDPASCRDGRCVTEHSHGTITSNVIAHCNDFGIYINKANQTRIERNTLINTYGIDIRFPTSSAILLDNQHDGMIRARDGAALITPTIN